MVNLSAKTARARTSLRSSAHNNGIVRPLNGGGLATMRSKERHAHPSHDARSFTLHGVHRTVGGVGRHYHHTPTHTPHRGATPRGHGGHGGTYKVSVTRGGAPQQCATNDAALAAEHQVASIGHRAGLHTRFAKGFHGHYPHRWVQKVEGHQTAEEYVLELARRSVCLNDDHLKYLASEFDCEGGCLKCETRPPACCASSDDAATYNDPAWYTRRRRPAPRRKLRADDDHLLVKLLHNHAAMPQSEYVRTRYMRRRNLPTPANRQHWPTEGTGAAGCGSSDRAAAAKTWEEAVALGRLPADYRPYT